MHTDKLFKATML